FLARISKGNLSDYSVGVKKLSLEEMKEVKGGYVMAYYQPPKDRINLKSELYGVAVLTNKEYEYIKNYAYDLNGLKGICGPGIETCSNPSTNRLVNWFHITNWSMDFTPVYIVKRQIKISSLGRPYVLFNYQVGVMDRSQQFYKFDSTTSGALLNNNMVIKEIANKYKENMEGAMGGWNPSLF
ncbi:bacteriocin, partial [Campylobacter sp. MIT 12-8780]|uniref:bacteriocin n=2 Tax=unclassified Campylobacter TaxID=2593542 RepID=UPI00163BFB5A